MFYKRLRSVVGLSFLLLFTSTSITVTAQDVANGETLFNNNCNSCHMLGRRMTGPNLHQVQERWAGNEELLYKFIQNSQGVINGPEANEYVKKLWEDYKVIMPAQAVTKAEIDDIFAYIQADYESSQQEKETTAAAPGAGTDSGEKGLTYKENVLVLGLILVVLLVVLILIFTIRAKVNRLIAEKEASPDELEKMRKPSLLQEAIEDAKYFLKNQLNPTLGVLTVGGLISVFVVLDLYNRGQDLGLQQGYAPDQPIKFSHKLHAGQYKIDCQYCHTGVEKSKNANIPSANICMNCHSVVQQGPKYGEKEIAKIYASIGFDPATNSYNGDQKPIEWVRIHNLPDHVYFSHKQHVVAGNLDCENCHGNVREMEVVQQVSLLEMGWCIDCHRETEVVIDNNFYQEHYHEVFKDDYEDFLEASPDSTLGDRVSLTDFIKNHKKYKVADLGGLECQRCHY